MIFHHFGTMACAWHRQVRLASLAADRLFRKSLICGAASGAAFFVARAQRTKSVRIRGENAEDGDVKGKKPCDFVVK